MTRTTAESRRRRGLAASLLAVSVLAAAPPALAQWREGGRREAGREGGREAFRGSRGEAFRRGGFGERSYPGERAFPERAFPERALPQRRDAERGFPDRGYPGRGEGPDWRGGESPRAFASPQGYGDPYGARAWRRGQVLPGEYRGAPVPDPGRYHLRRPPSGYDWVGDTRNAYLVQRSTGMVLDSVPGAYDPPPPYRGRRRER